MDPINGLNQIIEILRQRLQQGAERIGKRPAERKTSARAASKASKPAIEQLERRLVERLRSLDNDTAEPSRRAVRAFLESVLAWEFGEELLQDARFLEMARDIENQILSDPGLNQRLGALFKQLRSA